ncbi:MAG: Heavy metal efflux pump, CzcA family, partial [Candidatus Peribacteria bacterium GW2011_GWB1_54_5]
ETQRRRQRRGDQPCLVQVGRAVHVPDDQPHPGRHHAGPQESNGRGVRVRVDQEDEIRRLRQEERRRELGHEAHTRWRAAEGAREQPALQVDGYPEQLGRQHDECGQGDDRGEHYGRDPPARTIEGREKYDVQIRLKQAYRQDIEDIKSLPIQGMNGTQVLLGSIARIALINGPAMINSENGVLQAIVQSNVRGRDIGSFVKEADQVLQKELKLPVGYRYSWSGQYENQQRAKQRLLIVIPLAILLMFVLLYLTYKDFLLSGMVMLTIPLGLVGGVLTLFLARYNFSVAVWVGFISLFGNAVETGAVIIAYLENAFREQFGLPLIEGEYAEHVEQRPITREGIREAVLGGATRRLRPILMTAMASVFGLVPLLVSTGPGADVQRPLALVVAVGLTTSVFLALVVLPVLFAMLRERQIPAASARFSRVSS